MMNLLPIGSVVRLEVKDAVPIAIIGYYPIVEEKRYDYCGVVLPIGFFKDGAVVTFDKSQVKTIEYRGYEDSKSNALYDIMTSIEQT